MGSASVAGPSGTAAAVAVAAVGTGTAAGGSILPAGPVKLKTSV